VFQCYPDYYDATPSVAVDATGRIVVAYTFGTVAGGPKRLYTVTSGDGVTWTTPVLVNARGDSNFPQIAAGPAPVTSGWPGKTTAPGRSTPGTPPPATAGPAGPAR
jgi:hypothetical protein